MFVNMTPHEININGLTFPASGKIARVTQANVLVGYHEVVELMQACYGKVVDLPDPVDGVVYIVSGKVRAALPERYDLASPGDQIRDADGKIIGVKNLIMNVMPHA